LEYCKHDIHGSVETINWQFKTEMGKEMTEDDNVGMEQPPLDYFMACFPPQAMRNIIALTNKKLCEDDQQEMEMGELLKFFGVLILITQFEFNSQRDLWKPVSDNKFIPSPDSYFASTSAAMQLYSKQFRCDLCSQSLPQHNQDAKSWGSVSTDWIS
jgi:Transposase IS4